MKGTRCGQEAILALHNYDDGKSHRKYSKNMAKDNLNSLFYRYETTSSFKKYAKRTFNMLENPNVTLYEEDKVMQILFNINFPKNDFKTNVNIYRSSFSAIFKTASTHLTKVILRNFLVT